MLVSASLSAVLLFAAPPAPWPTDPATFAKATAAAPFLADPIVVEAEPGDAPAPVADPAADVLAWVDQRTGAAGFLTGMLYRKVPKGTNWYYTLGSATLFAFIVQAVTGVFLAMFYRHLPTRARRGGDDAGGEALHRWGAQVRRRGRAGRPGRKRTALLRRHPWRPGGATGEGPGCAPAPQLPWHPQLPGGPALAH